MKTTKKMKLKNFGKILSWYENEIVFLAVIASSVWWYLRCEYDVVVPNRKREATSPVCPLQAQRRHLHTLSWWDLNINFAVKYIEARPGSVRCYVCDVYVWVPATLLMVGVNDGSWCEHSECEAVMWVIRGSNLDWKVRKHPVRWASQLSLSFATGLTM